MTRRVKVTIWHLPGGGEGNSASAKKSHVSGLIPAHFALRPIGDYCNVIILILILIIINNNNNNVL